MPAICSSLGRNRSMTWSADRPRSARGLRDTVSRPRFMLDQPEVMPMVLPTLATAGSASRTLTTRSCRSAMALKLMSGLAVVPPSIRPVSWDGKKPFGT